jgi:hypothetical protein
MNRICKLSFMKSTAGFTCSPVAAERKPTRSFVGEETKKVACRIAAEQPQASQTFFAHPVQN